MLPNSVTEAIEAEFNHVEFPGVLKAQKGTLRKAPTESMRAFENAYVFYDQLYSCNCERYFDIRAPGSLKLLL